MNATLPFRLSSHPARKHGASYLPEYRVWQQMRLRCHDPRHAAWKNYGGRGIQVCDEWREDVLRFLADVGPRPGPKYEIDRIDNDRGYEPGNVRWVTRSQNCRNRRSSVRIEFRGQRRSLADLCAECGIPFGTAQGRLAQGWDPERVFTTPVRRKAPNGSAPRVVPLVEREMYGIDRPPRGQFWRVRLVVGGRRLERKFRELDAAKAQRRRSATDGSKPARTWSRHERR